jgi:hypothetical protein
MINSEFIENQCIPLYLSPSMANINKALDMPTDIQFFLKLMDYVCGESQREIKRIPSCHQSNNKKGLLKTVDKNLKKGLPTEVSLDMYHLLYGAKGKKTESLLVTGTRVKNGKCQAQLRTHLGTSCNYYKKGIECKSGKVWVDFSELKKKAQSYSYF